jgi:SAM-dependent methyltransferase
VPGYWSLNAAKHRIVGEVLAASNGRAFTVFDHGCGNGGDWPKVLRDHAHVRLVAWDPDDDRANEARERLAGLRADVVTRADVEAPRASFDANVVVSFSVFEHVVDRRGYLDRARQHLAADGRCYLNYDDGHFRARIDVLDARSWRHAIAVGARSVIAPVAARAGRDGAYQAPVRRADVDALVVAAGFVVERDFYSNLDAFKTLAKTIPPDQADEFTAFWADVERRLDGEFRVEEPERGAVNLWRAMSSRTLVLRHARGQDVNNT